MAKRDVFGELIEGVEAMRQHREGKLTLRTHVVEAKPPPPVDAQYIRATRQTLRMSAPVFARSLRVRPRTLERWEQGQQPGDAAAVLIGLVRHYPETLDRIASLETPRAGVHRKATKKVQQPSRRTVTASKQRKLT